jgi:hypothetical protein
VVGLVVVVVVVGAVVVVVVVDPVLVLMDAVVVVVEVWLSVSVEPLELVVVDSARSDVADETATAVPFLLLAATTIRSVEPTSPETGAYCCAVAPLIGPHAEPPLSHRCHW